MTGNFKISEENIAKAKVIDSMLDELGMSKQELIELIRKILEQSISEEVDMELSQGGNEVNLKHLIESEKGLSSAELAKYIVEGNIDLMARYLSLEDLKKLMVKINFAVSLKRAKTLGLVIDVDEIFGTSGLSLSSINLDGSYNDSNGKQQSLAKNGRALLKFSDIINNQQLGKSSDEGRQMANQLAQFLNDPNSLNNPNASVSIVNRVISNIKMQTQSVAQGANNTLGTSLAAVNQNKEQIVQQNQAKAVRRMEKSFKAMRSADRKLRKIIPEIGKTRHSKAGLFATITDNKGAREVNLKDYLRENNKLTPQAEKLIDSLTSNASSINREMSGISKELPDGTSFRFDASGRLQGQMQSEKNLQFVNIADYLSDLKRDTDKIRARLNNKKEEARTLKNKEDIEKFKELTRGPELDNANINALEKNKIKKFEQNHAELIPGEKGGKEVKEAKRMSEELVKLDALQDKLKLMESLKGTSEIRQIEASMKEVMKDMGEAEKNKDLLEDMRKGINKDRFLDK